MKNTKDNIIQEQTDKDLERELGIQMSLNSPIPKTKKNAEKVIKLIFASSKQLHYKPGENIKLGDDLKTLKDRIRFFEYGRSFHDEKEGEVLTLKVC